MSSTVVRPVCISVQGRTMLTNTVPHLFRRSERLISKPTYVFSCLITLLIITSIRTAYYDIADEGSIQLSWWVAIHASLRKPQTLNGGMSMGRLSSFGDDWHLEDVPHPTSHRTDVCGSKASSSYPESPPRRRAFRSKREHRKGRCLCPKSGSNSGDSSSLSSRPSPKSWVKRWPSHRR